MKGTFSSASKAVSPQRHNSWSDLEEIIGVQTWDFESHPSHDLDHSPGVMHSSDAPLSCYTANSHGPSQEIRVNPLRLLHSLVLRENTGLPLPLLAMCRLCKSNRKLLCRCLSFFSVWPSWSLSYEIFKPTQLLSVHSSQLSSVSVFTSIACHLNAEVFWQVQWIPISCDYQKWTRDVEDSEWHAFSHFTLI